MKHERDDTADKIPIEIAPSPSLLPLKLRKKFDPRKEGDRVLYNKNDLEPEL
jgi:hypothetical protein